jgi:hypothetical protein
MLLVLPGLGPAWPNRANERADGTAAEEEGESAAAAPGGQGTREAIEA